MPRTHRWMLVLLGLALCAPVSPAQTKPHRKAHKAQLKKAALPPMPHGPLPQLPMDLMPATPPKVSYQNGLLTIVAQNSTLSDILRDVHNLTGAAIDVPSNASERVVTRLGPGSPRDVLVSLLNGSGFNYVMLGSNSDASALTSVVLTSKPTGGTTQTAANAYPPTQPTFGGQMPMRPPVVAQPQAGQPAATEGDEANAEDQETPDENADQDQADGQQPDANTAVQPEQQQPNAGPKTPEQILEMLRRQQPVPPGQTGVPPPQQPPEN